MKRLSEATKTYRSVRSRVILTAILLFAVGVDMAASAPSAKAIGLGAGGSGLIAIIGGLVYYLLTRSQPKYEQIDLPLPPRTTSWWLVPPERLLRLIKSRGLVDQ